jgi:hypothetical protein
MTPAVMQLDVGTGLQPDVADVDGPVALDSRRDGPSTSTTYSPAAPHPPGPPAG